jgi:hypothetical protein
MDAGISSKGSELIGVRKYSNTMSTLGYVTIMVWILSACASPRQILRSPPAKSLAVRIQSRLSCIRLVDLASSSVMVDECSQVQKSLMSEKISGLVDSRRSW